MARVEFWATAIREAALRDMVPLHVLERNLAETLRGVYRTKIERGSILKMHQGVSRFTLEKVKPSLRAELDRRIMASANLIRLNRAKAVEDTLQRFSGWATSIPMGGSDVVDKRETKEEIKKPLQSLPWKERRCATDQGHKFVSNLNNILAMDGGAIAVRWNSHWRQAGYNYRIDHKERDQKVYLLRGNWAQEKGLVKAGSAGYYDEVTAFGEEISCRCFGTYLHSLRSVSELLTDKGREALAQARVAAAA